MKLDCTILKEIVSGFSLISDCDVVRDGSVRMATPFQYPDGSLIDLFVKPTSELFAEVELSDKGQTTAYLLDLHVKPWTTKKRKQMVSDICQSLGVKQDGGQFLIRLPSAKLAELPMEMVRLAQACIRITDIAFTQRLRSPVEFQEDFEEFVDSLDRPYETGVKLDGQFGKQVEFDFLVRGEKGNSLVQTLSTSNQYAAHGLANEVFRRWYDIANQRALFQCVTIYDTNNNVFRDDDLARIRNVSEVIGFPAEHGRLQLALAA
jgi:Domain of unknown function DUF1828